MAANAVKKILPMFDRVLVKRAEAATTTTGGIVLPEKAQTKMLQGTVISVGPGARNNQTGEVIAPIIKEGDTVLIPSYGGTKVQLDDEQEYLLFRESEILAKVK